MSDSCQFDSKFMQITIPISIHQFEWMVAGCCQTWNEHPIQSDHARPRSDLHPHIFATKARWRGIAHGLAHLPQVLAVGSQSHSHWSVNPAIGRWTSSIIVRWRPLFWKWMNMGGFQALFFQVPKFFQQENCGGRRPWSRRAPQEIRSQNGSPAGLGFKIASLTQPTHPALKIEVNPHRNIIPSDFFEAWLVRFVSWARQLQPQLHCVKWHKTSRVWNFI